MRETKGKRRAITHIQTWKSSIQKTWTNRDGVRWKTGKLCDPWRKFPYIRLVTRRRNWLNGTLLGFC